MLRREAGAELANRTRGAARTADVTRAAAARRPRKTIVVSRYQKNEDFFSASFLAQGLCRLVCSAWQEGPAALPLCYALSGCDCFGAWISYAKVPARGDIFTSHPTGLVVDHQPKHCPRSIPFSRASTSRLHPLTSAHLRHCVVLLPSVPDHCCPLLLEMASTRKRDGTFMEKPESGWIHDDRGLAAGLGIFFSFPVVVGAKKEKKKQEKKEEGPVEVLPCGFSFL